jgi:ribosomal-protein-alanine N-acetyltransferase
MYRRFGFKPAGIRKNYYVETNEDALVMWAEDINTPEYLERLARIEAQIPGRTVVVDDVRPTS